VKVIQPTPITDANLTSINVIEDSTDAWSGAATYALADRVHLASTHRVYESVQAANLNHAPETDDGTWWVDVGPTNAWAAFDGAVGTICTVDTPGDDLEIVLEPGIIGALAILECAAQTITVTLESGATEVYSHTENMLSVAVTDWYEYFFEPIEYRTELVILDIPPYADGVLTITINHETGAACGMCAVGKPRFIGDTRFGATAGIMDYSRKTTDEWGHTTIVPRSYARRSRVPLLIENRLLNNVYRYLAEVRATPCVWVGTEDPLFGVVVLYGFFRDFDIEIAYPTKSLCNLEIEGLT
jgi:hypothetical protein